MERIYRTMCSHKGDEVGAGVRPSNLPSVESQIFMFVIGGWQRRRQMMGASVLLNTRERHTGVAGSDHLVSNSHAAQDLDDHAYPVMNSVDALLAM